MTTIQASITRSQAHNKDCITKGLVVNSESDFTSKQTMRALSIMCGLKKNARGSPTLATFFVVNDGSEDPKNIKSEPSSAHQRNDISMAFR